MLLFYTLLGILVLSAAIHGFMAVQYLRIKKTNRRLRLKIKDNDFLSQLQQYNPNLIVRFDLEGRILYANPASLLLQEFWQVRVGEALSENWAKLVKKVVIKQEKESLDLEIEKQTFFLTFYPVPNTQQVVLYGYDISDKVKIMHDVMTKTLYDQETQLPNRTLLLDYIKLEMERLQQEKKIYLFLIYLADYAEIATTHDPKIVMTFMNEFKNQLVSLFSKESTLGRISERGFLLIEPTFYNPGQAISLAQKILDAFAIPLNILGVKILPRIVIGISVYPDDSENPDTLLRNVKLAQSRALAEKKQVLFYQSGMDEQIQAKRRILVDLHHALHNQELMLYYQPQLFLKKNAYLGAESLIRWRHSTRGFISPFFFITAAEESGLIVSIGKWIFDTVAADARKLMDKGIYIKLAVNLSVIQFMQDDLEDQIMQSLNKYQITSDAIELEITEGIAVRDLEKTVQKMQNLRKLGFSLAIDDFGTGYSSLSYLQQFPIQKLKIDRAFIKDMDTSKQSFNMTRGIIELGHSLNLKMVAEGAETKDQVEILRALECDIIQGYYYSPPVPLDKFIAILQSKI